MPAVAPEISNRTPIRKSRLRRSAPVPHPGESQPHFAIRYHREMVEKLPDTDARNRAMFAAWERGGDSREIERVVRRQFPADKFKRIKAVPYLAEHKIKSEGGEQVYDRDELARMVAKNNDRAIDVGLFAPLAEGHTPTEDHPGAASPRVLGYGGVYRLGMIGRKNPKWCIFADEFHHAEDADKLRRYTRRSPEVWDDGTIDPVAALGSTTPRLDMGMTRFCRDRSGQRVRRYAAFPAASNVYVPGFGAKKPKKYSTGDAGMALDQEDVAQIIDAMMDTEPMQWVREQMNRGPKKMAREEDLEVEDDDDDLDGGDDAELDDELPEEDLDREVDDDDEDPDRYEEDRLPEAEGDILTEDELGELDDDERTEYDALADDEKVIYSKGRRGRHRRKTRPRRLSRATSTERYARERSKRNQYSREARESQQLRQRVERLEREKRHAERYSRLQEKEGEGFVFDLEEEFSEVKDVPESEWNRHLKRVERYARAPVSNGYLPTPGLQEERRGEAAQKYSRDRSELAKKIALSEKVSFEKALELADEKLGGK